MPDLDPTPDAHPTADEAAALARGVPDYFRNRVASDLPLHRRLVDLACRLGGASEMLAEDLEELGQRYLDLSRAVSAALYREEGAERDEPG
ncbi:hypothetical protein [Methylobacterium oryzihabitans]|uniref:Uncharacterized protein n=1 Tax=Methylobacterium oryzihabitans TaxID=2499852 RepID=A0A437NXV8_9HYPH|nr:hypothetical protein [Methylobacterium oryzihabitans]RVU14861.1 hypothetical protein EOE48_21585 [Methylobacterium oryzihabitans]